MQLNDWELTLIVQCVFPFITSLILPLGAWFYHWLLSKLPANQQSVVEANVEKAVKAVEQAQSLVPGAVKKEYATNLTNALLKTAGVKATPEQVDTLIEAAVYQFNVNRPKQVTAAIPAVPSNK
ncbi:phage holin, LLH family [Ktedonospora formicarum]|uniref:Phage holin, LL-H family n=1 Tax=Ktedonospora formicarum TaxID=2778364 RepID=A0A8J3HXU5_9CHLR|nr:phage holin, LLH family [Ktedonospora formicarum]GHO45201.1 hypothetical protein KSX_33640 [Ktedonospora formicarum]